MTPGFFLLVFGLLLVLSAAFGGLQSGDPILDLMREPLHRIVLRSSLCLSGVIFLYAGAALFAGGVVFAGGVP